MIWYVSVDGVDPALLSIYSYPPTYQVDLAAPGENILSTARMDANNKVYFISVNGTFAVPGILFDGSTSASGAQGLLVECPNGALERCPGDGGHVCLARR
jgi:hypothetical protein